MCGKVKLKVPYFCYLYCCRGLLDLKKLAAEVKMSSGYLMLPLERVLFRQIILLRHFHIYVSWWVGGRGEQD